MKDRLPVAKGSERPPSSASVSVVIPTRDSNFLLGSRSLKAAAAQVGAHLDVIVIDDGSASPITVHDPTVQVIRHSVSQGVAAARNAGLRAAHGDWVAFLDDDDVWAPHKLRDQLSSVRAGGDFSYASAIVLDQAMRSLSLVPAPEDCRLLAQLAIRNVMPAGSSNVIVRTELLRELGGFDESFGPLADWDCWLRLAQAGTGRACRSVLVGHVLRGGFRGQWDHAAHEQDFARLMVKHAGVSERVGVPFDQRDFTRYLAVAHRRAGKHSAAARLYLRNASRFASPGDVARAALASIGVPPRRRSVRVPSWVDVYR